MGGGDLFCASQLTPFPTRPAKKLTRQSSRATGLASYGRCWGSAESKLSNVALLVAIRRDTDRRHLRIRPTPSVVGFRKVFLRKGHPPHLQLQRAYMGKPQFHRNWRVWGRDALLRPILRDVADRAQRWRCHRAKMPRSSAMQNRKARHGETAAKEGIRRPKPKAIRRILSLPRLFLYWRQRRRFSHAAIPVNV